MSRAVTYRYPWQSLVPDYARAAFGAACTGTPLALASPSAVVASVLAVLTALFVVFGAQSLVRQMTTIRVDGDGIRALPLGARVDWDALTRLRLVYFSVRRDRRGGWMELKLASGRRTLRIDSRLEGFIDVVRCAAAAAEHARLDLEPATVGNLADLGIHTGAEAPARD